MTLVLDEGADVHKRHLQTFLKFMPRAQTTGSDIRMCEQYAYKQPTVIAKLEEVFASLFPTSLSTVKSVAVTRDLAEAGRHNNRDAVVKMYLENTMGLETEDGTPEPGYWHIRAQSNDDVTDDDSVAEAQERDWRVEHSIALINTESLLDN